MSTVLAILLSFFIATASASEADYAEAWCDYNGGLSEYQLTDGIRVDCLLGSYAIEFDFAVKYYNGISQALLYAKRTKRMPALGLIMEDEKDCKYLKRAHEIITSAGIGLVIFEVGAYSYECFP